MFIVWGFRDTEKILGYTEQLYRCEHCNNVARHKMFRRIHWFTLFWIPLIPTSFKYFGCCPICNYGKKLKKEEAVQLGKISKEEMARMQQEGRA